jgi:hypothetical protein
VDSGEGEPAAGAGAPTAAAPRPASYRGFGAVLPETPADGSAAAIAVRSRDVFADPPGLAVRDDVLAAVGGPARVRSGALADLVARIEEAGHRVELSAQPAAPRRATPAALHREGSGRLWLFRRHPARFPLPRPRQVGLVRLAPMALGALRANALPPGRGAERVSRGDRARPERAAGDP